MSKEYLLKKIFQALITIIIVLIFNYILFRVMPGDPLGALMRNPKATPESIEQTKILFGLDQPWYVQFGIYFKNLIHGELGLSFMFKKPVTEVIAARIIPTVLMVGIAEIIAIIVGTFLGVIAACRRGQKIDVITLSFSLITYSMPTFWLGIVLVAFFQCQPCICFQRQVCWPPEGRMPMLSH